jgi:hypothetical protein
VTSQPPTRVNEEPSQYRRSRSRLRDSICGNTKNRNSSAAGQEGFAPAWRCGSCCRRRPPSNSTADSGKPRLKPHPSGRDEIARRKEPGIRSCQLPPFRVHLPPFWGALRKHKKMFFRSFWPLQSCIMLSESRLARLVNVNAEDQCTDASVFSLFRSGHEKKSNIRLIRFICKCNANNVRSWLLFLF